MERVHLVALFVAGTALLPMGAAQFTHWHTDKLDAGETHADLWRFQANAAGVTYARPWTASMFDDVEDAWALRWAGPVWSLAMVGIIIGALGIVFERRWLGVAGLATATLAAGAGFAFMEIGAGDEEGAKAALGFWLAAASLPLLLASAVMASFPSRSSIQSPGGLPMPTATSRGEMAASTGGVRPKALPTGWSPPAGFDPATGFFRR